MNMYMHAWVHTYLLANAHGKLPRCIFSRILEKHESAELLFDHGELILHTRCALTYFSYQAHNGLERFEVLGRLAELLAAVFNSIVEEHGLLLGLIVHGLADDCHPRVHLTVQIRNKRMA